MDRYNHFEYCEKLARKLKPIQHTDETRRFFKATEQDELSDLEQRLSDTDGVLLIAIDGVESAYDWKDSDSLMKRPSYKVAIVEQTTSGDTQSIFNAQEHCKKIGEQVIAYMMNDYHDYVKGMDLLLPSSFQMKGFGPIGNNYYGILMSYTFDQGVNYEIDPELWD